MAKASLALALASACATTRPATRAPALSGVASYYADSLAGRPMANGKPYDPQRATCAHKTLPFGTRVRVTMTDDERASVECVITDRGPFVQGRVIDLSKALAKKLGIVQRGLAPVEIEVLD